MSSGSRRTTSFGEFCLLLAAVFLLAVGIANNEDALADTQSQCALDWGEYDKSAAETEALKRRYWRRVAQKSKARRKKRRSGAVIKRKDYVLEHPPAYSGPDKPDCPHPEASTIPKKKKKRARSTIPVEKDFLRAADKLYDFTPRRVSEAEFMRRFAQEATRVGFSAGQVVGVYALETGGLGPASRQSGIHVINKECEQISPKGRPASTALGYVQLLAANSAVVLYDNGARFARSLEKRAKTANGAYARELRAKAKLLRKMRRDINRRVWKKKSGSAWRRYRAFARTENGRAVHALNLDADVGPMLQVHKLLKIKQVAKKKGHKRISAAQLQLMNLVGYGRGLEMMRRVALDVPTSNFFSRAGYERNPVAGNLTADGLLDRLGGIISRNLEKCGSVQFLQIFSEVKGAN